MRRALIIAAIDCGETRPRIVCRLGTISDLGVQLLVPFSDEVPDEFTLVLKTTAEIRWRCTVIEREEGAVVARATVPDKRRR